MARPASVCTTPGSVTSLVEPVTVVQVYGSQGSVHGPLVAVGCRPPMPRAMPGRLAATMRLPVHAPHDVPSQVDLPIEQVTYSPLLAATLPHSTWAPFSEHGHPSWPGVAQTSRPLGP